MVNEPCALMHVRDNEYSTIQLYIMVEPSRKNQKGSASSLHFFHTCEDESTRDSKMNPHTYKKTVAIIDVDRQDYTHDSCNSYSSWISIPTFSV